MVKEREAKHCNTAQNYNSNKIVGDNAAAWRDSISITGVTTREGNTEAGRF
jgi:hypothetical protein